MAVLKNKKAFFDQQALGTRKARSQSSRRGVLIVEDLTAMNLKKLVELKKDPKIEKAWSINGKLKYVTKEKPNHVLTFRFN